MSTGWIKDDENDKDSSYFINGEATRLYKVLQEDPVEIIDALGKDAFVSMV